MDFKDYSEKKRAQIIDHLTCYLKQKKEEDLPAIFKEQRLIDSLETFSLRGKLLRGSLFLFASEMLGVNESSQLLDIACAIELMHSSLLIQDDIIDKDRTRRGIQTIFSKYEDDGDKIGAFDSYHYGISSAIVVADIAFFFAVDLVSNFNNPSLSKLFKYYSQEIYLVALAESADSIFGQTSKEPDRDEIFAVYKYKTARYTFSLPFEMACIVANSETSVRTNLKELGEAAGLIFQLKDDELGIFGDENIIGKPVGSDIRENKKTLIRFLLLQKANYDDKKLLSAIFGNPNITKDDVTTVKNLYKKYNLQEIVATEISTLMDTIWMCYERIQVDSGYKMILKSLLEFNVSRSS